MIASFRGATPAIHPTAYVVDSAVVIGDVVIGADTSVWFHAVVRGDVNSIRIGRGAIVHGCAIGDRTLVGMGAIVLDGVEVGADCLIGAGALLTPSTRIAPGQLVVGS